MSVDDTIENRQNNEFSVLCAMYEDVKDLRVRKRNKWVPLDFAMTLLPQRGDSGIQEINAKVDLHVVCSTKYPYEPPKLLLENAKGLSNTQLSQLEKELQNKANDFAQKGEEMILQLVQQTEEFLYVNNKPATKSFYEEMILRRQKEEEFQKELEETQKRKEREIILYEIQKRRDLAKNDKTKRNSEGSPDTELRCRRRISTNNRKNTISLEEPDCNHSQIEMILFTSNVERSIQRGRCINHSNRNCIVFNGMDINSGHVVVITEWEIIPKNSSDQNTIHKFITSIEQEFNYIIKLKHQNLAHYLGLKVDNDDTCNKTVVQVMREFIYGSNCTALFTCENIPCEIDRLKHIADGVLSAIDFLHRNNVVHKNIRESCIYINKRGIIKVANYSLDKRLTDFTNQCHSFNYSKKTDIYDFGIFILSILTGVTVTDSNPVIPNTLPSDLYDFLSKCLTKNEKDRLTAIELMNHQFLQSDVEKVLPRKNSDEVRPRRNSSPETQAEELHLMVQNSSYGQSRVYNEFEVLDSVGKGAFGEVFKVKNKLDQRCYAIKRIILNPKEAANYKRLIREVKYLSRLNHENVVRYFNSWIEKCAAPVNNALSPVSTTPSIPEVIQQKTQELSMYGDVEKFAPPPTSMKGDSKDHPLSSSDEDSETESEDDESIEFRKQQHTNDDSLSSSVEFIREGETSETETSISFKKDDVSSLEDDKGDIREFQLMYIQMEFCEKSTLRTAIDDNLYEDIDRVWRLFREIVEGLAHIHQQGLIHRDLKPVNIFLDLNDHVKIGDFGLATTTCFLPKPNDTTGRTVVEHFSSHETDGTLTGQIGTALYIAPEIERSGKVSYNAKVDVFSLGVIMFEMCYKPLHTHMERIVVLKNLRSKEIIFPEEFLTPINEKQIHIIKWLLNHDVDKRPSSSELLQSDYIPPPVLEERELRELVRTTLNNPQLKAYKYLVESCFKQTTTPAHDIVYCNDQQITNNVRQLYSYAKRKIIKIFHRHGGQNIDPPLLLPKSSFYKEVDSVVNLMTHSGSIVILPHDLRVPYARYVARSGISLQRRYSIEKVFREKKVFDSHPRELYECAFDIVSPTPGNFMSDAEVLYILYETVNSFYELRNKDFTIYLNHKLLLISVLIHCGIKDKHNEILQTLADAKGAKLSKIQIKTRLSSLGLTEKTITTLVTMLEEEGSISEVSSSLQTITRKKNSDAAQIAKQALLELKVICQNTEALGVRFPIVISLGLIHNNIPQYSGLTCQLACRQLKKNNKQGMEVLAAGGRYDSMISHYRTLMEKGMPVNKVIPQSAVGISISLDKLVQTIQKSQSTELSNLSSLDASICSLGSKFFLKEKAKILRDLWALDIRSCLIDATNLEEVDDLCVDLNCPYIVILKDTEDGTVVLRSREKDRYHDKRINSSDLVEHMQKILRQSYENYTDTMPQSNVLCRSESKSTYNEHESSSIVSIYFETTEKYSSGIKRRYEHQIRTHMESALKRLLGDVTVIAVNLEAIVVRTIVSYLEFDPPQYEKSVEQIIEKHTRYKKYLRSVCEIIYEHRSKTNPPTLALYSLLDSVYKCIL